MKVIQLIKGYERHSIKFPLYPLIEYFRLGNTMIIENNYISKENFKVFIRLFNTKPDILVIFHFFGSPFILPLLILSRALRVKTIIVTDFAETGLPKIHKHPLKTFRDILRYILLFSQLLLVDIPVCFTEYEKNILLKIFPRNKFRIIPLDKFKIGTSEKENYILTVSRWWSDRKNLHTIVKVFAKVVEERDCKLVVVGKFHEGKYYIPDEKRWESGDEYKQKVMKLIKKLNLEERVEFAGVADEKTKEELYRKAKIFYLPSKNEILVWFLLRRWHLERR